MEILGTYPECTWCIVLHEHLQHYHPTQTEEGNCQAQENCQTLSIADFNGERFDYLIFVDNKIMLSILRLVAIRSIVIFLSESVCCFIPISKLLNIHHMDLKQLICRTATLLMIYYSVFFYYF